MALVGEGRIAGDHEQPADLGECRNDLLDHAVGEVFLLRIAAHIGEGQHRDRRLVGEWQSGWRRLRRSSQDNAVDPQRPGDVLEVLLADIGELGIDFAAYLSEHVLREADAAGFGDALEPCRDVDAVAVNITILGNDVAKIDTDPEGDLLFLRCPGVALDHCALHGQRAGDCLDDARELDQEAVAGRLDDAAAVVGDCGIDQVAAMRFEPGERAFLVLAHQPAIARDIGCEDRR